MKRNDLMYYKTMQIVYSLKSYQSPVTIQRFFSYQETKCDSRDFCKFTVPKVKKEIKRRCPSVLGVTPWNDANINVRRCSTFQTYRRMVLKAILSFRATSVPDIVKIWVIFMICFTNYLQTLLLYLDL